MSEDEYSVHAAMISDAVEQAQQNSDESINQSINDLYQQDNHGSMFRLPKLAINQSTNRPIYSSILAPSREDSISCCARIIYDRIRQSTNESPINQSTNQSYGSSSNLSDQSSTSSEYDQINNQSMINADPFDVSHFSRKLYSVRFPSNLLSMCFANTPTYRYHQSINPSICPCPSFQTVHSFIQHVFNVCNLSIECSVIAVLYIDRLESIGHSTNQSIRLHVRNWMPLLLTSLLSASKVWDDQSSHNSDFLPVVPGLTIQHLNYLEREFLSRIQYELYIASSEYARYFFAMRDVKTRQEKIERAQAHKQEKRLSLTRSLSQSIKKPINEGSKDPETEQDREIDALTRGLAFTKAEIELDSLRPIFRPGREMPMSL